MKIEEILKQSIYNAFELQLNHKLPSPEHISLSKTKKEFEGQLTLVLFPYLKLLQIPLPQLGQTIGNAVKENCKWVENFTLIQGFLNFEIHTEYYLLHLAQNYNLPNYGHKSATQNSETVLVEYASPNTNKPLHLGHLRNILLGYSLSKIYAAVGKKVFKVNVINDRGVHICKSMLAYKLFGNAETPESSGLKGDHLVGKYYVTYDQKNKEQIAQLVASGVEKEIAEKETELHKTVNQMLILWENNDQETIELWKKMNQWVYDGFAVTYKKLGVDFDKIYYESNTYLLGKNHIQEGLKNNVFYTKEDNSVWIDLSNQGLDHKLLLRNNGTSVYITQDIGTIIERANEFNFSKHVYVVGNEQDYHFKVLFEIVKHLGYNWANGLYHLSYGMVELPNGKMKSREGTVVDADELIETMEHTAKENTEKLGKTNDFSQDELSQLYSTLALGALKYFLLKVEPKKKMLFNPEESIDFHGHTGPFIQYAYARSCSLLRKANVQQFETINTSIKVTKKEKELLLYYHDYEQYIESAAQEMSTSVIANYAYEVAKEYNQWYHDTPILKEENVEVKNFRLMLSYSIAAVLNSSMALLGIQLPNKM
jgi:arginyl-tRNA synthetase